MMRMAASRTIWTLWYQGFDHAPPLVHACLDSWRRLNPEWQVVALDRHSLADWIDLRDAIDPDRSDLTVQKISDIARLCLLRSYGGVWTDPTVFCLRPLQAWLPTPLPAGFAAFRNPARDRLIGSWFIAAGKDSALLAGLYEAFVGIMNSRTFSNQNNLFGRIAVKGLQQVLGSDIRLTTCWLSPWLQDWVRAHPYLIFHYTFNKLILTNPDLRRLWQQALPLEAGLSHSLQAFADRRDGLAMALEAIDRGDWTLQKLDWRTDLASPYWSAVMRRLADHVWRHDPAIQSAAE
jgi:hypothetical protein